MIVLYSLFFFFFSSRRRHTRLQGDWNSDVCSSDLCLASPSKANISVMLKPAVFALALSMIVDVCGYKPAGKGKSLPEIGRASCRERGKISVVAVSLKKKKKKMCVNDILQNKYT